MQGRVKAVLGSANETFHNVPAPRMEISKEFGKLWTRFAVGKEEEDGGTSQRRT